MSMSTKIEDLPGSNLEQIEHQNNMLQTLPQEILGDINSIKNDNDNRHLQKEYENNSNVKMNVKRVHFEDENGEGNVESFENNKEESIFSFFKNLLSEENILLLILFLLSSQTDFDRYPRSIPYIGAYIQNPLVFTLIKCIVLVLCFAVTKKFVLPRIKL